MVVQKGRVERWDRPGDPVNPLPSFRARLASTPYSIVSYIAHNQPHNAHTLECTPGGKCPTRSCQKKQWRTAICTVNLIRTVGTGD